MAFLRGVGSVLDLSGSAFGRPAPRPRLRSPEDDLRNLQADAALSYPQPLRGPEK